MLMTLTECKRKPGLHRQCPCVCVCVHEGLWKTDHHDITISTGNHVSKTLVFHSAAYLIHNSLLSVSVSPCLSLSHTWYCVVAAVNEISLIMSSSVAVPTSRKGEVISYTADDSTESGYYKLGCIFIILATVANGYDNIVLTKKMLTSGKSETTVSITERTVIILPQIQKESSCMTL